MTRPVTGGYFTERPELRYQRVMWIWIGASVPGMPYPGTVEPRSTYDR